MPKNVTEEMAAYAVEDYRAGVKLPAIPGIVAGEISRTTLLHGTVRPQDQAVRRAVRAAGAAQASLARRTHRQAHASAPLSTISIDAFHPAQKGSFAEIAIRARLIALGVPRTSSVASDEVDLLFDPPPEWGCPGPLTLQIKKAQQKRKAGSDDPVDNVGTPTVSLTKHNKQTPIDRTQITAVIGYDEVAETAFVFPLSVINPATQSVASCTLHYQEAWSSLMSPDARARLQIPNGPWRFDYRTLPPDRLRRLAQVLVQGQAQREAFYATVGDFSDDVTVHDPERVLNGHRRLRCVATPLLPNHTVRLTTMDTADESVAPWDYLALWDTNSNALAGARIALIPRARWVRGHPLTVHPSDYNRAAAWTALGATLGFDRLAYAQRRVRGFAAGKVKRQLGGKMRPGRGTTAGAPTPAAALTAPPVLVLPASPPMPSGSQGFPLGTLARVESHLQHAAPASAPAEEGVVAPTGPEGPPPRVRAGARP